MDKLISHDSETPAPGLQVVTVDAFLHHQFTGVEKLFLAKRAPTKKFLPGVFETPGGHINFDEDPTAGLKREILEELGIEINVGDLFYAFSYINPVKGSHSTALFYFATTKNPISKIKLNPQDHSEFGWFSENEIERAFLVNRNQDDKPLSAVRKGFALLSGSSLDFG